MGGGSLHVWVAWHRLHCVEQFQAHLDAITAPYNDTAKHSSRNKKRIYRRRFALLRSGRLA
jgi:hypothetical protein